MWSGLILYNTGDLSAVDAYNISNDIFNLFNITAKSCSHYEVTSKNDDLKLVDSNLENVKFELMQGSYKDFHLSDAKKNKEDDSFNFIYQEEYGSFHGIILLFKHNKQILENRDWIIRQICNSTQVSYGIFYQLDDSYDAISYFNGTDYVNLFSYEDVSLFEEDLELGDDSEILYNFSKLRMVYTYNILNKKHLNIEIGDQNLKEFILADGENGILEQINDYQFIWKVEEKYIDRLNKILGEAGVLISYEVPEPSSIKKLRLP